jgi:hypothetical protein
MPENDPNAPAPPVEVTPLFAQGGLPYDESAFLAPPEPAANHPVSDGGGPAVAPPADEADPVVALGRQYAADGAPPPQETDPVVKLGSTYAGLEYQQLQASLHLAAPKDPERQAKVLALAKELNAPAEWVDRNFELASSQKKLGDTDVGQLLREHPELAQWLSVPDHSAVAHDDVPVLRAFDLAMRALTNPDDLSGNLPPGYAFDQLGYVTQKLENGNYARIGTLDQFRNEYLDWLKDIRESEIQGLATDHPQLVSNLAGFFGSGTARLTVNLERLFGGVSQQDDQDDQLLQAAAERAHPGVYGQTWRGAVGLASDLPLMFLGGLASKALPAATRVQQAVRVMAAYAPINVSNAAEAARLHGLGYGAMNLLINSAVPAAFPLLTGEAGGAARVLLGDGASVADRGWAAAAVQLSKDIGVQVGQQEAQEAFNAAHEYLSGVDPQALSVDRLMPRLLSAAILAGAQTGIMHAPGAIIEKFHRDTMAADAGRTYATNLQTVIDTAKQSKLAERSPELMADLAAKLGGPNRLTFMQAEQFDRLAKATGAEPLDAARALGAEASYKEALATGGDVAVPVEKFIAAAAQAEGVNDIAQHAKPTPEAMTGAEAESFRQAAPEQLNQVREQVRQAAAQVASDEPTRQVFDDLVKQLTDAGTEASAAKRQASILAAGFRTLAERMNAGAAEGEPRLTARDLYDRYGLTIARADNGVPVPAEGETVLAQPGEDTRRGQITFAQGKTAIHLFEQKDLSTVLHEGGHLFLQVYGDLAAHEKAPEQIRGDYAKILAWLGVKDRSEIGTAQHEQFAKGFETYLMEGKAPSLELRETFARVKQWFADLYRKLTTLGANLTDDVRGVFDRLLATDDEIANAEAEAKATPLFAEKPEGMSDSEWKALGAAGRKAHEEAVATLQKRLEAEARKAQTEVYHERRKQVAKQVTEDVRNRPVFLALNALQNGKLPNGEPMAEAIKLDKADLEARGVDLTKLPGGKRKGANRGRHIYTTEDGITADQAAEVFGFASGADLLRALTEAPDQRQQIATETEARMRALYPDSRLDGSIYEKAADAVQNENRAEVVHAELKALRKLAREAKPVAKEAADRAANLERAKAELAAEDARQQATAEGAYADAVKNAAVSAIPPVELVRAAAKETIRNKRIREVNAKGYLTAARKASREAFAAAAKGDWNAAAEAKQRELMSHELYRAATDRMAEVDKNLAHIRDLQKQRGRERIGKAGGWEWTVTNPDGSTQAFGTEAEAEHAAKNVAGATYARTSGYLEQMDALLARFDLTTIPYEQVTRRESLAAWIAEREAAGEQVVIPDEMRDEARRTNWRSLTVDEFAALNDAVRNIEAMALNKRKLLEQQRKETLDEARKTMADTVVEFGGKEKSKPIGPSLLSGPARAFGRFVGALRKMTSRLYEMDGFKHGALWDHITRRLNEASDRERTDKREAAEKYSALAKAWGKLGPMARVRKEIPGLDRPITLEQRIMVALNWGNEGNRKRLLRQFTQDEVHAILDSLDEKDWHYVQGTLDLVNSYWYRIAAKQQRVTGVAPEKVDALPVETRFGTFKGGYFPIAYDPTRSTKAHGQLRAEQASLMKAGGYGAATTRRNHTKARAEDGLGVPLRLEFGVLYEHLNRVFHDLAYHETLIDINRLLNKDGEVETAIRKHYGDGAMEDIRAALEDSAAGDVFSQDGMERAINWIASGSSTAAMAWNLQVALMNGSGIFQVMTRVGAGKMAKTIGRLVANPLAWKNAAAWVDEMSPYMRERARMRNRTIGDVNERLRATGVLTPIRETFHYLVTKMDRAVGVLTWVAAHEKALEEHDGDVAKAAAIADSTVRETQGSNDPHDLASIQRGHPLKRLFTQFIHYANTTYNLRAESLKRYGSTFQAPTSLPAIGHDLAATGKLAVDMMLLYVLPAAAVTALRNFLHPHPNKDKDATITEEIGGMLLGEIPLARDFSATLFRGMGYHGPTGTRGLEQLGTFAEKLHEKWEHPNRDTKLGEAAFDVAGVLTHWPTAQTARTAEGFAYWLEHGGSPAPLIGGPPPKR